MAKKGIFLKEEVGFKPAVKKAPKAKVETKAVKNTNKK